MFEIHVMIYDLNDARLGKAAAPADGKILDLDEIENVTDYSRGTLEYLKQRIEQSAGIEQFVYREMELDVVWRLIDCAVAAARLAPGEPAELGALETLRAAVIDAHDLLGNDLATAAVSRLGTALI